jgi:hypothetical protein
MDALSMFGGFLIASALFALVFGADSIPSEIRLQGEEENI